MESHYYETEDFRRTREDARRGLEQERVDWVWAEEHFGYRLDTADDSAGGAGNRHSPP